MKPAAWGKKSESRPVSIGPQTPPCYYCLSASGEKNGGSHPGSALLLFVWANWLWNWCKPKVCTSNFTWTNLNFLVNLCMRHKLTARIYFAGLTCCKGTIYGSYLRHIYFRTAENTPTHTYTPTPYSLLYIVPALQRFLACQPTYTYVSPLWHKSSWELRPRQLSFSL